MRNDGPTYNRNIQKVIECLRGGVALPEEVIRRRTGIERRALRLILLWGGPFYSEPVQVSTRGAIQIHWRKEKVQR